MVRMNETLNTLLNHRSIRDFTEQEVGEETMGTLFDAAMRASTSRGFQHASVIRIKDTAIRQELARIGNQRRVATAPELMVFIVDARRSVRIREELGEDPDVARSADVFREGFTDAVIMAQNLTVAAESKGLGACYLGCVLNEYETLIDLLKLPEYTFPVVGLMLGHPASRPGLKPRMPKELRIMEDTYSEPESWVEALAGYNATMREYYGQRETNNRDDGFTSQVVNNLVKRPSRNRFFSLAKAQGFNVR